MNKTNRLKIIQKNEKFACLHKKLDKLLGQIIKVMRSGCSIYMACPMPINNQTGRADLFKSLAGLWLKRKKGWLAEKISQRLQGSFQSIITY